MSPSVSPATDGNAKNRARNSQGGSRRIGSDWQVPRRATFRCPREHTWESPPASQPHTSPGPGGAPAKISARAPVLMRRGPNHKIFHIGFLRTLEHSDFDFSEPQNFSYRNPTYLENLDHKIFHIPLSIEHFVFFLNHKIFHTFAFSETTCY